MKKSLISVLIFTIYVNAHAFTSVYVPVHGPSGSIHVFNFDGTTLTRENTVSLPLEYDYVNGPVDIAIDPESNTLFIANEDVRLLALYDSKNLKFIGNFHSSTPDGTGIEYDSQRERVYMTSRNMNKLYIYDWDGDTRTLSEISSSPVTLSNISYACGLAIDGDKLYVSEYLYVDNPSLYDEVFEYDIDNDFQYVQTHIMPHNVVGIACDTVNDYLYGGAYGSGINYLDKHDLLDSNNDESKDIGFVPVGLDVDQNTGYLFVTAVDLTEGWSLQVWDPNNWNEPDAEEIDIFFNDSEITLSNLCGLCVADGEYRSEHINVEITDYIDPNDPNDDSCLVPGNTIDYDISFNTDGREQTNTFITCYLPKGLTFESAAPNTAVYDILENTITWDIGDLSPGNPYDPNFYYTYTISVMVNEFAEPTYFQKVRAYIESDSNRSAAIDLTPICCWEDNNDYTPGVIFVKASVDQNQPALTGTSWSKAYPNLTYAIDRINNARSLGIECGTEIWVAQGTYSPGDGAYDSFEIPDGIEVYGGFAGNESARTQRDWAEHKTILSGYVEEDDNNKNIVIMGDDTLLDGLIVEGADDYGIKGVDIDFQIANCVVKENSNRAIDCENSNVSIDACIIKSNSEYGVYHKGSSNTLTINRSKFFGNLWHGIYCENSTPTITNCMIYDNGSDGDDYYGISLYQSSSSATLRNNTIAYNNNYGISYTGANAPTVTNSILWGNNDEGDLQAVFGCDITYSNVQDPNITSNIPDPNNNIHIDPDFAYGDASENFNFHLSGDSECIDIGYNTGIGIDEVDIDGEIRIENGTVDMGADEYVSCTNGVSSEYDINADGIINLSEYSELAELWLLDSTDTGWNETWDLNEDDAIGIGDLKLFTSQYWLWRACWHDVTPIAMMSTMSGFMMEPIMLESLTYTDVYDYTVYVDLAAVSELSLEAQLYQIADLIKKLENLPLEYPNSFNDIDKDEWEELMDKLYAEELRLLEAIEARDNIESTKPNKKNK